MSSAWLEQMVCGGNREKYISFQGLEWQAKRGRVWMERGVLFPCRHREPWRAFNCVPVPLVFT